MYLNKIKYQEMEYSRTKNSERKKNVFFYQWFDLQFSIEINEDIYIYMYVRERHI